MLWSMRGGIRLLREVRGEVVIVLCYFLSWIVCENISIYLDYTCLEIEKPNERFYSLLHKQKQEKNKENPKKGNEQNQQF